MKRLISLASGLPPPQYTRSPVISSVRKGKRSPLHQRQAHRGCNLTTSHLMNVNESLDTRLMYEPLEGIERIENYRPGGYHPVQIGDHFRGRYQVVHKLGHGAYSTVWLARDENSNTYVALKVCTANASPKEAEIISTLNRPHCNHPGMDMVPSILDRFDVHGPNGNHACYVTAPARASLAGVKDASWIRLFQLNIARSLAAQLVLVVDHVHAQGVVHGDLHLGNILLKVPPNFDQLSTTQLYEKYGAPEREPVVPLDGNPLAPGVPSHGVAPIWLGKASEDLTLPETGILLADFGESFLPAKEQMYESRTPLVIRPPEVRFEPSVSLSFPSDIWSLACTIWTLVAQRPLFEGFLATDDDMTCEHVDALGVLPLDWWNNWEARQLKFTDDGRPINRNHFRSWDDRFEDSVQQPRRDTGMQTFDVKETKALFNMLRPMLSFRPEDRPTAKQILKSEWMLQWAMPEYAHHVSSSKTN